DISILKLISTTEGDIYQVLATNGDTHLGGDDIDNALAAMVRGEIAQKYRIDFAKHPETVQELRKTLIHTKHQLSSAARATIRFALPDDRVYARDITREEFDEMIEPIIARTMAPVKMALADAKLQPADMDEVVMVGGSTRIPLVRKTVGDYFGRAPHCELNPDEVVALGAAVQANILESGVKDMLLLDVTPLSLGIETMGGVVAKLIPRNSTIPASAQELFTTGVDNQTGIDIHILQGERELARDCRSLSRFQLKMPAGPAGLARVEVKFLIDANGILQVAAKDLRTGEQSSLEVQPSYGLTDTEMERMLEESIEFAEQDFQQRQLIEARNEAETILRATERTLTREETQSLATEERAKIDASVKRLREAAAGTDYKLVRKCTDELNDATMNLAEMAMNKALQAAVGGRKLDEV
ncbi:MAG: Hsp70 family protein, partial [Candidatus Acidiferrales bacterium]